MTGIAWAGLAVFGLVSLVVGARLLGLWRRTRQRPELLCAVGLLGIGPLGFAPALLSTPLAGVSPLLGSICWGAAFLAINTGTAAVFAFTRTVFHQRGAGVEALTSCIYALLGACWGIELFHTGFAADQPAGPAVRLCDWLRTAALLWAALESLRYYGPAARRVRLGLADPVVVDRFLLWGVGIGIAGASCALDAAVKTLDGNAYSLGWLNLLNSAAGVLAAAAVWLAFLPPERYVARVRARAGAAGG